MNTTIRRIARALRPKRQRTFGAVVKIGTGRGSHRRSLVCYAASERGAKRIAGRFYRELYPERAVTVLEVKGI